MNLDVCPINFRGLAISRGFASVFAMSRRARKRGNSGGAGWLGKAVIILIAASILSAAVFYAAVRSYLHSDAFRVFMSDKASALGKVDGTFTSFRWEGLSVETSTFDATGRGAVKTLRLDGLHTEIGLSGLRRGVWEIRQARARRIEMLIDTRGGIDPAPVAVAEAKDIKVSHARTVTKPWLPTEVEVKEMDVGELKISALTDQGQATIRGLRANVEPGAGKHTYRIDLADGLVQLPFTFVPEIRLDKAHLNYNDENVFLSSFKASVWENGQVEASGEWNADTKQYSLEGNVTGVKCEDVFNENWAKRFIGDLNTDFTVTGSTRTIDAKGKLTLQNGTLTALPVLDALAAYADTRRFRVLPLSEAHTNWRSYNNQLAFTNLVLASEGLVRLEGDITITDRQLDGRFRLGLAPGTLASIPGAETDVFFPGERGLVWTPLRITGTLDDPKEDLTDRLKAAAGLRMFDVIPETGEKIIKFSRSIINDPPSQLIERGTKIIEESADIVEGVGGVIDGFFGKKKKTEEEPNKPNP
ncbi:MAG: hypothetical protein H8M99_15620 [Gloeobacteraceae cyanobacterium ES-bin-144]|nr:hypothetical protein [Verrucomicrobiales bacterium]